MQKRKWTSGKRMIALVTALGLVMGVTAGCGKSEEPSEPAATQPGDSQAADPNDPLAQFPPLKLPFTVKPEEAIVTYQGGELTGKEFEQFMKAVNFFNPSQGKAVEFADQEMIKTFAREVAATEILASRADDKMREESKAKAGETFDRLKQQYLGMLGKEEAKFEQLLKSHGVTREELIGQMAMINDSIAVLSKDVQEVDLHNLYESDKASYTKASVRHILISTEQRKPEEALKLAQDIAARLKKGEDFAKLAKEHSEDPGSKDNGGLYADADVSMWVEEFKQAALTLPIGQVSDPVKTDYGYHVMKVEKREKDEDKLRARALESRYDEFTKNELEKLITKWNLPEVKTASK